MRIFDRLFISAFFIATATSNSVFADTTFGAKGSTSTEQTQTRDGSKNTDSQRLDCTKSRSDPRCNYPPRPQYPATPHYPNTQYPDRYPQPYRSRPVIINQYPEEQAIEINSLTDDWDGCRKAKLGAIKARHSGRSSEANDLDDWLWKNCRSYSNELRQLEQDDM